MPRDRLRYVTLPVAALLCILPLIVHGPSCGHDFTFHLLNWFEAAAQFRHGNLHPQWAFSPAWNAGEPRFVFYPPLSWTFGAILGLLMPWTWTPIAYTWLALSASGLAMHRLARAYASPTAALVAATLYLANPYMLFTAYERTAYAELLAAAFLPLLFHAILKPRPTIPAIAIPLTLLWLTNAPAAVMGTYSLALLTLIRLVQTHRAKHAQQRHRTRPVLRLALTTAAGTLLGLAVAAFYILSAAANRTLVQIAMVVIPGMRVDDNTLFHHTGQTEDALAHDLVLHTASLIALLLLSLTAVLLFIQSRIASASERQDEAATPSEEEREPAWRNSVEASPAPRLRDLSSERLTPSLLLPLTILTLTIAFLLTPLSLPLWHHAPELAFLQFPWRLLAVQAVALSLALAVTITRISASLKGSTDLPPTNRHNHPQSGTMGACLAFAITLTAIAYPTFQQPCDTPDTAKARLTAFQTHQGAEPTDEYTPASADNDSLKPNNPPFWLSPNPDAPPPPGLTPGSAPEDFTLEVSTPEQLILNLRQYPAWHITLDGIEIPPATVVKSPRADGLINFPIPLGQVRVHLSYRTTPLEHFGDALSALAFLLLVALCPTRVRDVAEGQ